jgi:hypothetical protein
LRLLLDAAAVGELRVFGIEALGSDPLFVHLASRRFTFRVMLTGIRLSKFNNRRDVTRCATDPSRTSSR